MFEAVKGRLARQGYFLLSCCVYETDRVDPEVVTTDSRTGRTFVRWDETDLFERETERCYCLWRPRESLPDARPQDYDGTLCVNGQWYIHRRLYRTHQNLRAELESHGFEVIYQGGEVMQDAVCVHKGSGVSIRDIEA